jgi:hypothetical protein
VGAPCERQYHLSHHGYRVPLVSIPLSRVQEEKKVAFVVLTETSTMYQICQWYRAMKSTFDVFLGGLVHAMLVAADKARMR